FPGSHANGFYGNSRSRCRNDYTQEYRKAAQPPPPDIFVKRMKETPSKHIFSKHDNRHAFPGSATYFESGLGRRRIEGSLPNTHNLIDWVPLKDELQRDRPLMSSYQSDFRSENKVPQLLIHHAQLQEQPLQRTPSTTYQHQTRKGDRTERFGLGEGITLPLQPEYLPAHLLTTSVWSQLRLGPEETRGCEAGSSAAALGKQGSLSQLFSNEQRGSSSGA
uniref:Ciliary microtubule inner protein 7 n=1 Tax=Salvator merianae TaxID=96440 RepID=A0A8D0DSQ7_SALMN